VHSAQEHMSISYAFDVINGDAMWKAVSPCWSVITSRISKFRMTIMMTTRLHRPSIHLTHSVCKGNLKVSMQHTCELHAQACSLPKNADHSHHIFTLKLVVKLVQWCHHFKGTYSVSPSSKSIVRHCSAAAANFGCSSMFGLFTSTCEVLLCTPPYGYILSENERSNSFTCFLPKT
jgi:hypothetical protein